MEFEAEIIGFFEVLYKSEGAQRFSTKGINRRPILIQHSSWSERKFEEAETWNGIKSLGKNKAPGLDGFTIESFAKFWQHLKEDITSLFA